MAPLANAIEDRERDCFTLDKSNLTAKRVVVGNAENDPVPVYITDGPIPEQNPKHLSYDGLTTPNTTQVLISYTVPALKRLKLMNTYVVNRHQSRFKIKVDGNTIGSGATGPGETNVQFKHDPVYFILAGEVLTLELTTSSNIPASDLEAYMMGLEESA